MNLLKSMLGLFLPHPFETSKPIFYSSESSPPPVYRLENHPMGDLYRLSNHLYRWMEYSIAAVFFIELPILPCFDAGKDLFDPRSNLIWSIHLAGIERNVNGDVRVVCDLLVDLHQRYRRMAWFFQLP